MAEQDTFKLVLVRHGESLWNKENKFTGWADVPLSDKGKVEAKAAAEQLKSNGYTFDVCYTSLLKRAILTLGIIQEEMDLCWLPVHRNWRLNERMYGALQGLNKAETAAKHGEDQVKIWRRAYDIPPPALDKDSEFYPGKDRRYDDIPRDELPLSECLKDTVDRFLPFWHEELAPAVKSGKRVLVAAHGNSIRALVKFLDNVSEKDIVELNIPTGLPLVYELDKETLKPVKHYYLADEETVKAAAAAVANQGKAK